VPENELFLNKADAYEVGHIRLTRKIELHVANLNELIRARHILTVTAGE